MDVRFETHQGDESFPQDHKQSETLNFATLIMLGAAARLSFRRKIMPKTSAGDDSQRSPKERPAIEIEIDELDGIGPATKAKLNVAGIITVLDLAAKSPSEIADVMNSDLATLLNYATRPGRNLSNLDTLRMILFQRQRSTSGGKLSNGSLQVRKTWMIFSLVESKPKP